MLQTVRQETGLKRESRAWGVEECFPLTVLGEGCQAVSSVLGLGILQTNMQREPEEKAGRWDCGVNQTIF